MEGGKKSLLLSFLSLTYPPGPTASPAYGQIFIMSTLFFQLPLANQVNQPNEGVIVNGAQIPYNDGINENDQVKSQDIGGENGNMDTIDKLEGSSDSENKDPKNPVTRKTEQRKINKGTKRETAPRFQSIAKGKVPQSPVRMYSEGMVDKKRVSTTMEDVPKSVLSKVSRMFGVFFRDLMNSLL